MSKPKPNPHVGRGLKPRTQNDVSAFEGQNDELQKALEASAEPAGTGNNLERLQPILEAEDVEDSVADDEPEDFGVHAPASSIESRAFPFPVAGSVGDQLNGDFVALVRIPEVLVQGCKDFAEQDGNKSVDQWATEFFTQALEAYCQPMQGR